MSEQIWIGFMIGWVTAGLSCWLMFWLMTRPLSEKWNAMVKYIDNIEFRFIKIWDVWINENSNFYNENYRKLDKLKDRLMNFNNLKIEGETI